MFMTGQSRLTSAASMSSESTPRCLFTSARQRAVRMAASVWARVKCPRSEYMMLMSSSPGKAPEQLHRLLVERHTLRREIVGAHDGRIAGGVTAPEPGAVEHRNVPDAVA